MTTDFIPPFPPRPEKNLGALETLFHARKDPLSIWSEDFFTVQFRAVKVLNRQLFVANCPEVVRDILVTRHTLYGQKSAAMQKALKPLLGDSLFISEGEVWRSRRQLLAPLFADDHIGRYAPAMVAAIQDVRQRWSSLLPGTEVQVVPEMLNLATDIICRIAFGKSLGERQTAEIAQAFSAYQTTVEQTDISSFLGLPSWLPSFHGGQGKREAEHIHKLINAIIAEAIKAPPPHSVLALLLDANNNDGSKTLSVEQISNELIMLVMAGYETTANTLAWAWYLISQRPEVEARLHQEIDRVLGQRPPTYDDVAKLSYTTAIIEESLRLYPPVPMITRQASAEDTIRKRTVPAGSMMLIMPWLLHRHKLYWQKPDHFMPERFLPNAAFKHDPYVYLPFGGGSRVCLGKSLALAATTLCLATIAQQFRLCLPAGYQLKHECRLTLRPKGNLPMRLESRR